MESLEKVDIVKAKQYIEGTISTGYIPAVPATGIVYYSEELSKLLKRLVYIKIYDTYFKPNYNDDEQVQDIEGAARASSTKAQILQDYESIKDLKDYSKYKDYSEKCEQSVGNLIRMIREKKITIPEEGVVVYSKRYNKKYHIYIKFNSINTEEVKNVKSEELTYLLERPIYIKI